MVAGRDTDARRNVWCQSIFSIYSSNLNDIATFLIINFAYVQ